MKYKKIMQGTVMLWLLASWLHGHSQQFFAIHNLPAASDSIAKVYYLPSQKKAAWITAKSLPLIMPGEGPFQGLGARNFLQQIQVGSGKKMPLRERERVIDLKDTVFITEEVLIAKEEAVLRRYVISGDSITLAAQCSIFNTNSASLLANGNVLVTDQYELFGQYYNLLDRNLALIKRIQPFDHGFETGVFTEQHDTLYFAFKENSADELTFITADTYTGNILKKVRAVVQDLVPQGINVGNKSFIITGDGQVAAIAEAGIVLWQKKVNIPFIDVAVYNNGNNILACTDEGRAITCFNAGTGRVLWVHSLKSVITVADGIARQSGTILQLDGIKAVQHGRLAGVALRQVSPPANNPLTPAAAGLLILFDSNGSISGRQQISNVSPAYFAVGSSSGITIVNKQNLLHYEE